MRGRPTKEIVRNVAVKIRLTPEENTLLANVCERTGQTKSEVIRNALNEYSRLVATKAIDINEQRCRNAAKNQRMNIKRCHCGDYTPFITDENIEVIPQVNLTRTDMDILGDIAEALAVCGCFGACDFLCRVQSEVTKIVEYQEER